MNIYFIGIGGVGLGPLAQIALDAGHTVQGSDIAKSRMTEQLEKRGVMIGYDQKGNFLQQCDQRATIDWIVYSAGIPADHPELELAEMLAVKKVTKRDELLHYFLKEKNLKLLAIAGTHGKTTTAAMAVWTIRKLGIPVSYSVGTTLPFGPSGSYVPGSQYFIYECDEFDRNFLQFHPTLSLITSIDYDHPDSFGTPEDYIEAFRQFIGQSQWSMVWQGDANLLGELPNVNVLNEADLAGITLAGEHNRRNASLVVKSLERLGVTADAVQIIDAFPGSDRRFEMVAPNLYSDYGHHPTEIDATLQMASELSDDIVLVYQPHQNIRQHQLRTQYIDCFERANEVYWLPTYLTREDPNLPVLSPDELTEGITNRSSVHASEMDDALWETIQKARDRGALVLVMGAGSIDGWLREMMAIEHSAQILVMDIEGNFVLQLHDDNPDTFNPGKLGPFGGKIEMTTDTSFLAAAVKKLQEQTNLEVTPNDLAYFKILPNTENGRKINVAYYVLTGITPGTLEVKQGQGYMKVSPNDLKSYPLTIATRSIIAEYTHPAL